MNGQKISRTPPWGKPVRKMLVVLLLCDFLACGSPSALTGNWQFTLKSSTSGNTYTGMASLTQGGPVDSRGSGQERTITGTMNFDNNPCATSAPLSGTILGLNVIITAAESGQPVSLTGTANAAFSKMSGTYSAPGGGCNAGDFGSWTASKS